MLNALPDDAGLRGRAHGGRMLGAVMPVWYIGSLVLVAIWAIAGWHHHGTGLVVTAGALLILSVIMSILLLVPINNRGKTWTCWSPPSPEPAGRHTMLAAHNPHSPGGSGPPKSRHPGILLPLRAHNRDSRQATPLDDLRGPWLWFG